jgi:hypothetical protein
VTAQTALGWYTPATHQLTVRTPWTPRPRALWRLDERNIVAVDLLEPWRVRNLLCDLSSQRGRALSQAFLPDVGPSLASRRFELTLPAEPVSGYASEIGTVAVLETLTGLDPANADLWRLEADVHRVLVERFVDGIGEAAVDETNLLARLNALNSSGAPDDVSVAATLRSYLDMVNPPAWPEVRPSSDVTEQGIWSPELTLRGARPAESVARTLTSLRPGGIVKGWDVGPSSNLKVERSEEGLTVELMSPCKDGSTTQAAQPVRVGKIPTGEGNAPALDTQPEYAGYALLYAKQLTVKVELRQDDRDAVLVVDLFRPRVVLPTSRDLLRQSLHFGTFLFVAAADDACRDVRRRLAPTAAALGEDLDEVLASRPTGGIAKRYQAPYCRGYKKWKEDRGEPDE